MHEKFSRDSRLVLLENQPASKEISLINFINRYMCIMSGILKAVFKRYMVSKNQYLMYVDNKLIGSVVEQNAFNLMQRNFGDFAT